MTPPRSALEWAAEWDLLRRCPHVPSHDNEKEYLPSVEAYHQCLAEFFIAYAAEQIAALQQKHIEHFGKALDKIATLEEEVKQLKEQAAQARAEEREACAKVADEQVARLQHQSHDLLSVPCCQVASESIAAAIRRRG